MLVPLDLMLIICFLRKRNGSNMVIQGPNTKTIQLKQSSNKKLIFFSTREFASIQYPETIIIINHGKFFF